MPVTLGRPAPFVEELCTRLERAAGFDGPVLDRGKVQAALGMRFDALEFAVARRAHRLPGLPREGWEKIAHIVRALDAVEAQIEMLERNLGIRLTDLPDDDEGYASLRALRDAIERAQRAWQHFRGLAKTRRRRVEPPRMKRRHGRPRDEIAEKVASVLVPLWRELSSRRGAWRDAMSGEWRGGLLEVALWLVCELGGGGAPVSRATLARALLRHTPQKPPL